MSNLTSKELDALRKLAGALYELNEYASQTERFNNFLTDLGVITKSANELYLQLIDVIDEEEGLFVEVEEPTIDENIVRQAIKGRDDDES
jgi:hypothetical protein